MKRISIWHVIFSSLFFVLAFFTILTFALSGFIADFNQMSRLVTQPKGVYFYIVIILLMLGIATNCFYLIRNFMGHLKYYWLFTGIILLIFCNLFYYELFIEQRIYFKFFSLEDSLKFSTEEIFQKRSHIIMTDYIFYTLFIAIPCLIGLLNLKFKKTTALGRFLNLTQPSFNLVIAGLFGFSISPFFKSGIVGYIDFALLLCGFLIFLYFLITQRSILDSYEYFNLFLLSIILIVMIVGNHNFMDGESYFEVRKAFYILVFLGWCNEWNYSLR